MRLNLILAFAGGVAIASGLMVVGVRHYQQVTAEPAPVVALADATPTQTPALPEAAPTVRPVPAREHSRVDLAGIVPARKPSPMPEIAAAEPLAPQPAAPPEEERTVPPPLNPASASDQQAVASPPSAPAPEQQLENAALPHSVTLQPGTQLRVRIGETLSTDRNRPGDRFLATLEQPLVIDGFIIAERGARLEGEVVTSEKAARGGGLAHLAIRLVKLETADQQHVRIQTGLWNRDGSSSSGRDAATIFASTAIGAAIGGMAGGGKGAAIGAAAGGAAGTAGVLAARGPGCTIPVETRLAFDVEQPVRITERLN